MIGKHEKSPSIRVFYAEKSVFSYFNDGIRFRIDLFVSSQPLHFVFNDASSQVSLSHNTKMVCCAPDSSSVVSESNCAIREVDDLVTILKIPDNLCISGDYSVVLRRLFLIFIDEDRIFFCNLFILHDSLLDVAIGKHLYD